MAQAAPANPRSPQNPHNRPVTVRLGGPQAGKTGRAGRGRARVSGDTRASTRGGGAWSSSWSTGSWCTRREEAGAGGGRSGHENGRRQQCEAATEAKLAAKLEKVTERLRGRRAGHGAARRGPDRALPGPRPAAGRERWSRKHADTQRRLCERFAAPVIAAVTCQDITTGHMQKIVNAAPTAGEGDRVRRMHLRPGHRGIDGGYLTNPRLAKVHWQAGGPPAARAAVSVAGESALWVDPAEIPSDDDVARLGQALAAGRHGERDELMANVAAYSGLRLGRTGRPHHRAGQPRPPGSSPWTARSSRSPGACTSRRRRTASSAGTIYPAARPAGYPLAERLAARIEAGPRRAGGRDQPARADLPQPAGQALAVLQLRPPRPGSPPTWRPAGATPTATARGPGTACGTCSAPPPCSPGSSTPPTCPAWPATPTTASPSTCTSAPPPASWTAPAPPPNNHARPR